jgi:hypothetical protein
MTATPSTFSFSTYIVPNRSYIHLSLALITLTLIAFLYKAVRYDKRRQYLPPMVPAWPIINHTFLQQEENAPPLLQKWAHEHGEIFRTRAGTTDFIWLNSMRSVKELYDRRSAIYSSRQPMPMACDTAT